MLERVLLQDESPAEFTQSVSAIRVVEEGSNRIVKFTWRLIGDDCTVEEIAQRLYSVRDHACSACQGVEHPVRH